MKKIVLGSVVAITVTASVALIGQPVSAACGSVFHVGANAEAVSACGGINDGQEIDGFAIDVKNNKITLENYNGGAIYYFCRATCDGVKKMEIELIGENTISSDSSSSFLKDASVPQNAAFINIVPKFTGKGTLTIKAGQPIAFEAANSSEFAVEIIGMDFEKTVVGSSSQEPSATVDEPTEQESVTTTGESTAVAKKSEPSFFETPLGIALLVAVPSVLVIVIVILLVALSKKNVRAGGANDAVPSQE